MTIHDSLKWENITPEDGSFTFGYYDRCAWDASGERHLALKIPQQERLPVAGERAEVGYVCRDERKFVKLAETEAWCHQQGAMTLWLAHRPGCFIYNDFVEDGDSWLAVARIMNADTGKPEGEYDSPIYTMSPDGKWGVSLDFGRIPRRGYSYARATLIPEKVLPDDPDSDGLFLINMETGEKTLIASYTRMMAAHTTPHDLEGAYVWLNHAIFNCDASRVMVLLRHCPAEDLNAMWKTHMVTMNLDGSDLFHSLPHVYWRNGAISHQIWGRTPREILVDADWCGRGHEYIVYDESKLPIVAERISKGMGPHAHLVFSPDGKWMAADTYSANGFQRLALVKVATGELREIGRFRHGEVNVVDVRCDLHPRWSRDGSTLTIDTIHEGDRKIYMLDTQHAFF